jgi:hypothetical protein
LCVLFIIEHLPKSCRKLYFLAYFSSAVEILTLYVQKTKLRYMKKAFLGLLALSMMVAIGCKNEETKSDAADSSATVKKDEAPAPKLSPEEEQKRWMEYATPGAVHQMIAKSTGTWIGEANMWMHPDSPAIKMTGTAVNKMILGGRYQESVHTGTMMGMPFEGKSVLGYDNIKKVFQSTWIDNMGTGVMTMEGTWDEASKTITSKGKMVDPSSGKELDVRETYQFMDNNNHKMEMFCTKDGKEMKTMELMIKRKK